MPDELFSADGSKFFIGGALSTKKAAFTSSDFTSQTWVEVDLWQGGSVSSLGAREVATNRVLNRDIPIKTAGGGDPGTMELVFLWKGTDAGQIDLAEAYAAKANYAFKVEHASGEDELFVAIVSGFTRTKAEAGSGDADKLNVTLAVNSVPVLVAA